MMEAAVAFGVALIVGIFGYGRLSQKLDNLADLVKEDRHNNQMEHQSLFRNVNKNAQDIAEIRGLLSRENKK